MIYCPNCNSISVKIIDKFIKSDTPEEYSIFQCQTCLSGWNSVPEARKDYEEYLSLIPKTTIVSRDVRAGGSYGPAQYINPNELVRRSELAKKITKLYKHVLDIGPGEWYELHQDAL